jgi:Glycosyl hydrolase family 26
VRKPAYRRVRGGAPGLAALLTAIVCVATAASAATIRSADPSAAVPALFVPAGVSWPSGAYCGSSSPTCLVSFATWRGRPVTATTTFTGSATWAGLEGTGSWLSDWASNPYRSDVVVTVPMIPTAGDAGDATPTLAEEGTGAYAAHFQRLAQRLVSAGMGSATIRLGHELNGTWYAWSARPDPQAFVAAWRSVVTTMRAVPGASFSFDWNVAVGAGLNSFDARTAYPGDTYVDTIGEDVYDTWWGQPLPPEQRWARIVDPGGSAPQGLQFWADFAAAHGKPNSYAEWGLVGDGSSMGHGGEGKDDPYFVEQMHTWFATHRTAFEVYFNRDPSDGTHRIDTGAFPLAAQAYLQLFGTGTDGSLPSASPSSSATPSSLQSPSPLPSSSAPTSLAAPTVTPSPSATASPSTTPCDGDTDVVVSASSSRESAVPLCGSTLSGAVYVFARSPSATSASFFVDNVSRWLAPTSLDLTPPYDLMGTRADGTAKPWDLAGLMPGAHSVTVLLPTSHGTHVETVTFTVRS